MRGNIIVELEVDTNDQWFAFLWVKIHTRPALVRFKIDTGCNALVLSHSTLAALGYSTAAGNLAKLSGATGRLASGEKSAFKNLGNVQLFLDKKQCIPICTAQAICHATHETNDLLGTKVLRQFCDIHFHLTGDKYMELLKSP